MIQWIRHYPSLVLSAGGGLLFGVEEIQSPPSLLWLPRSQLDYRKNKYPLTPQDILSDQGLLFFSEVFKKFCKAVNVTSLFRFPSSVQCSNRTYESESRIQLQFSHFLNPLDWRQFLPWIEYADSHVSSATGLFSSQVYLGYQSPLFPSEQDIKVS